VLAAVRATTTPQRLSVEIIGLLDDDKRNGAGAEQQRQGEVRLEPGGLNPWMRTETENLSANFTAGCRRRPRGT